MAITARINVKTGIGRATISQPNRSAIVAQNFRPKPDVSLVELNDVSIADVKNCQVIVYNCLYSPDRNILMQRTKTA